jgi:O-antigen/teichoic acid export membrane protein
VLVTLVDQLTLALSLYLAYRYQKLGSFYWHFDIPIAKQLLKDSWPLIFSGLVVMIYMRIDQVMIKEMLGEREVGLYSAAVRLSEVWYFIPIIVTSSLFPAIVSAKKESEKLYYTRLQRLFTTLVWMAIVVAVATTFLSDWLVALLYGEAYKETGRVLMLNIWTGLFVSLGVASSSWLTNENLQQLALYRTLSGAISNIILNFLLIPIYGIGGAAIATLISYMAAALIFDIFHKKTRRLFIMKIETVLFKGLINEH